MAKTAKDMPLQLRRRADGTLHLLTDEWPPRHEFSTDWLMRAVSDGVAKVDDENITVTFANGRATYRIESEGEPTTGIWGYLVEGKVNG